MSHNSPSKASRLAAIFASISVTDAKSDQPRLGWAKVFEVPPDDTPALLARISDLVTLYWEVQTQASQLPRPDKYLSALHRFKQIVDPPLLTGGWSNVKNVCSKDNLHLLDFVVEKLGEVAPEVEIPESELEQVVADVVAAQKELANEDLPFALKAVVADLLEISRGAIHDYRYRGEQGMRDGLELAVGKLLVNHELFQSAPKSEAIGRMKAVLVRMLGWISGYNTVAKALENSAVAGEAVGKMLNAF